MRNQPQQYEKKSKKFQKPLDFVMKTTYTV